MLPSNSASREVSLFDVAEQAEGLLDSVRVRRVVATGQFVAGPQVGELEAALAAVVGVPCVPCASGSDALTLSLLALGVGSGDVVLAPALGFIATAEAALRVGARVRFVDVRERDLTLCPADLERVLHELAAPAAACPVRAVVAVDLFGTLADYESLSEVLNARRLPLVEDAAQAFGAGKPGKWAGAQGDIAALSFFPTKPLGCVGDGGAVFCKDQTVLSRVRSLCVHGREGHLFRRVGMNSRLDTLQAAVLLDRLPSVAPRRARRREIARYFDEHLPEAWTGLQGARTSDGAQALYVLVLRDEGQRARAQAYLAEARIQSRAYYERALPDEPVFLGRAVPGGSCPVARRYAGRLLAIPCHASLTDAEVQRSVDSLLAFDAAGG